MSCLVASWGDCGFWGVTKYHTLAGFPCEEKSTGLFAKHKNFRDGLFIDYRALRFTRLSKCKSGEGCRRSKSAPAPCLHCQLNEKIMVLFFLSLQKVHSIWALAF
jgi:hypothetical protein